MDQLSLSLWCNLNLVVILQASTSVLLLLMIICSGASAVTSTAGSITTTGCTRTQTMTWNASDACATLLLPSRTATWTVDTQGPVITITGGNLNPGCNPASINFGSASANDNCSGASVLLLLPVLSLLYWLYKNSNNDLECSDACATLLLLLVLQHGPWIHKDCYHYHWW
jgi:hypothetical protein